MCYSDVEPISVGKPPQRCPSGPAPPGGNPAAGVVPPSALGGVFQQLEEEQNHTDG